ncbi:MAG: thrombospondin type 3 repeat-containing protein [Candidatus Krumholzibacteriia bacterium]
MNAKKALGIGAMALIVAVGLQACSGSGDDPTAPLTPQGGINAYGGGLGSTDDIDDLYYLRADGNPLHDYGTMQKALPTRDEHTHCDRFVVFDYGPTGPFSGTFTLTDVYFHVWYGVSLGQTALQGGWSVGSDYGNTYLYAKDAVSAVGDYKLVVKDLATAPTDIVGDDILDFQVGFTGLWPDVLCNPDQYSFVILNVPDSTTLAGLDTDGDTLNDYQELYVAWTNPYDSDTDNDGVSDAAEVAASTDPNDFGDY